VKFYNEWSQRGTFVMVPDDAYFGFARVVYIAEKASWPGSLPYGSLEIMTLSPPGASTPSSTASSPASSSTTTSGT